MWAGHGPEFRAAQDKIRSVSFILGLVCMITLFVKAA